MQNFNFESTLVCPKCKTPISKAKTKCKKCKFICSYESGIWNLLYNKNSKESETSYEKMHNEKFHNPGDGSYEILAMIAKGNKALDIACGDGYIEKLSPDTVGVEFSLNALKKAKKNGAKNLVLADAHNLPFKDNSFDIAICAGSLEHFSDQQKAINEMARVAKIQIFTVHRSYPFPFSNTIRKLILKLKKIDDQPIENPLNWKALESMLKKSNLKIIFRGYWTYPFNIEMLSKKIPNIFKLPSCYFVISQKN